jgi:hypothetical protein
MASAATVVRRAMKSLHARLWKDPIPHVLVPPRAQNLERYELLRAYIERYDIEPTPANYALLYRHHVQGETHLTDAVTKLVETGYAPETTECQSCAGTTCRA